MSLKSNTVRIVLSAVVGSVFWAGCASSAPQGPRYGYVERTDDIQANGPDTHPENRTGAYDFYWQQFDVGSVE